MDANTLAALQTVAAKLGTTAEHVWAILLSQAPISAALWGINALAFSLAMWLAVRFTIKHYDDRDWEATGPVMGAFAVATLLFCWVLSLLVGLNSAVTALINPEYWALNELLRAIKGR